MIILEIDRKSLENNKFGKNDTKNATLKFRIQVKR